MAVAEPMEIRAAAAAAAIPVVMVGIMKIRMVLAVVVAHLIVVPNKIMRVAFGIIMER